MKICILRANALGDFIFSLPALEALRAYYPDSEIVYLGCPWHFEFLKNRPSPIDRVIVIPPSEGVRLDGQPNQEFLHNFFDEMQKENFDTAYQLHGGGKYSNQFIKKIGAKKTIGLLDKDAPPLDISIPYIYYQPEYLRLLEVVGVPPVTLMPHLKTIKEDRYPLPKPYVVIHPGASDFRRRWPIDRFQVLGSWFLEEGINVVVVGNEVEITNKFSPSVINLGGKLNLNQLTGVISNASLFIGNDSGPYHLAVALNTPAVGVFWCGNVINAAPLLRSRHRQVISWQTRCSLCNMDIASPGYPFTKSLSNCQHYTCFVDSITADDVIKEIKSLLY